MSDYTALIDQGILARSREMHADFTARLATAEAAVAAAQAAVAAQRAAATADTVAATGAPITRAAFDKLSPQAKMDLMRAKRPIGD